VHGFVAGRVLWILSDLKHFSAEEVGRRFGLALSRTGEGASFIEGLLRDQGEILVHSPKLLEVLDDWICHLSDERFQETLPLLRRTFATFPAGVRANLIRPSQEARKPSIQNLNMERAARVLPIVRLLLGQEVSP